MQPSPPPPPQPPPNAYSWEIFPHLAYELKEPQKANVTYMFMIIGVILVVMALIGFIASFSIIVMAQSSEGVDFGSDIRLIGVVKSESGENLSGVVVSIQGTDLSAVTNHRGQYSIRNAPGGIWRIKASLQGYKNSTQKVLLVRDISDQVDFELKEGSGDVETNSVGFLYAFSIVTLFFSVFILAGAYFCFNGTRFSVVLVSSILGCCSSLIIAGVVALGTLDPWYAIGILLALFSFLLVIAYRKEFKTHEDAENE